MPNTTTIPDHTAPAVLLRVYDATEYETVYAMVELTPAFCQRALDRIALAAQFAQQQPQFDELRWWDYTPHWFKRPPYPEGDDPPETLIASADRTDDLLDATFEGEPVPIAAGDCPAFLHEALNADDAALDPEDSIWQRVECVRMCVDAHGLYWYALVKHTDVDLTTVTLTKSFLEAHAGIAMEEKA